MVLDFKCGYVAIIGYPNVGKSTLLNGLIGERLAITSPKPQTTRHRILGILNRPGAQLLFLDTPGMLKPRSALHQSLVKAVMEALSSADVVVWLTDPRPPVPGDEVLVPQLRQLTKPLIVAINKIDRIAKPEILPLIAAYHELFPQAPVVPISALLGDGLSILVEEIIKVLPTAPPLFPEDYLTDKSERFLVAELIRQRLLHHLGEEIPHAAAVVIEEFDESRRPELVKIRAVIYVEKDSQKGIVIGKGGRVLKAVGREAREEIEHLLEAKVFLDLWVKVWKNWRRDPKAVRAMGYEA
ncbi:MAG: GTPase Era [Deltaproteobacteria bacterium]|nr:GTPase Era [Deltaproteobacteria bacterium]